MCSSLCARYTRCLELSVDRTWSAAILLGCPLFFLFSPVFNQIITPVPASLEFTVIPNYAMFATGLVVFVAAFVGRFKRVPALLFVGSVVYRLLAIMCGSYLIVVIRHYVANDVVGNRGDVLLFAYPICIPTFIHAGAALWVMGARPIAPSASTGPILPVRLVDLLRPRDATLLR